LSIIDVFYTNPPQLSKNRLGKNKFNLFAIILVGILYEELCNEIGLNLEKEKWLTSFGTNAMKKEFILPSGLF
jgi:hypothetical protein